jgi:transcriptional/translational regulatory protein YebC/TACO1
MSIESLNNFLKTNQLKRNSKVTIDMLLDCLEELVDVENVAQNFENRTT